LGKTSRRRLSVDQDNGKHLPLENAWTFWFDEKPEQGVAMTPEDYANAIKSIGTFKSIQLFWRYWNNLETHRLPVSSNLRIFKRGIKPMWEVAANRNGGKWTIYTHSYQTNKQWGQLVLALIGEQFEHSALLCGAVLSIRQGGGVIALWINTASDAAAIETTTAQLRRLLQLPANASLDFRRHRGAELGGGAPVRNHARRLSLGSFPSRQVAVPSFRNPNAGAAVASSSTAAAEEEEYQQLFRPETPPTYRARLSSSTSSSGLSRPRYNSMSSSSGSAANGAGAAAGGGEPTIGSGWTAEIAGTETLTSRRHRKSSSFGSSRAAFSFRSNSGGAGAGVSASPSFPSTVATMISATSLVPLSAQQSTDAGGKRRATGAAALPPPSPALKGHAGAAPFMPPLSLTATSSDAFAPPPIATSSMRKSSSYSAFPSSSNFFEQKGPPSGNKPEAIADATNDSNDGNNDDDEDEDHDALVAAVLDNDTDVFDAGDGNDDDDDKDEEALARIISSAPPTIDELLSVDSVHGGGDNVVDEREPLIVSERARQSAIGERRQQVLRVAQRAALEASSMQRQQQRQGASKSHHRIAIDASSKAAATAQPIGAMSGPRLLRRVGVILALLVALIVGVTLFS
jgi:translation initiation factor 4E